MNSPLQIGITGGIGSGKSLICKIFHCLGVPVYDADSRAKYIMTTDGILVGQMKKEFGDLTYNRDGTLNRAYLSKLVFDDSEKLIKLNNLVHPRVGEDYIIWVREQQGQSYVLKEAAIMLEKNSRHGLDKVIVVHASEALRVKRVLERDKHRSEEQIKDIINHQMPEEERLKHADFVIVNDETKLVIPQVLGLHNQFKL